MTRVQRKLLASFHSVLLGLLLLLDFIAAVTSAASARLTYGVQRVCPRQRRGECTLNYSNDT